MGYADEILALLLGVALLAQLAQRLDLPVPVVLVVGGGLIGFIPALPDFEIDPDVVLLIFLPPLLLEAAWGTDPRRLREHIKPIALLSIGLVIATAVLVALLAHYVVGLPAEAAWVLGAIVAPTDPVAAETIFRRLGAPRRVSTIVGWEGLLNDAVALVVYHLAVTAALDGDLSTSEVLRDLVLAAPGGALIGLAGAYVALPLLRRLGDPSVFIIATLALPYGVYLAADALGLSAVLAVAAAGLYIGWHRPQMGTAGLRLAAEQFWGVLAFMVNALLFVLVGLTLATELKKVDETAAELIAYGAVISLAVIAMRFVFAEGGSVAKRIRRRPATQWREGAVIGWSGMRGGVSLALALAVPQIIEGGAPFPDRELVIVLTFAVILVTLVGSGLTLPYVMQRLGLGAEDDDAVEEASARLDAARAGLTRLSELALEGQIDEEDAERFRVFYEDRVGRMEGLVAAEPAEAGAQMADRRSNWLELLEAERASVLAARDRGELSSESLSRLQRELDLEESKHSD